MKLTRAYNSTSKDIHQPTWQEIEESLNALNGKDRSHLILDNESGQYIQCAGSVAKMTIEYRQNRETNFRHYVLGNGGDKSPMNVTWVHLETGAGEIAIHEEEVLTLQDAIQIFRSFYESDSIPVGVNKRNVTKLHV